MSNSTQQIQSDHVDDELKEELDKNFRYELQNWDAKKQLNPKLNIYASCSRIGFQTLSNSTQQIQSDHVYDELKEELDKNFRADHSNNYKVVGIQPYKKCTKY